MLPIAELSLWAAAGVAVASGLVSGFLSPLLLNLQTGRKQKKLDRSAREMLLRKLEERDICSLERLSRATGTTEEDCKRLLRELDPDGHGVRLKDGREGWTLARRDE
jgi:hypothetical protein